MFMRFGASPEPPPPGTVPEGYESKVMHACFRVGESQIMASDGCGEEPGFQGFNLTLAVETEAEADRAFNALVEGGIAKLEEAYCDPHPATR